MNCVGVFVQAFKLTMSVTTFGFDSFTYYPFTPSTLPRGLSSNTLLASRQESVSPPCQCQVFQTKEQLLTPQSSLGSLSEAKSAPLVNIEPELYANTCIPKDFVESVLQAVREPGPNSIVEIRNATLAMYDALIQALDEVKPTSLHYDAVSSKIIVYGPPSHVHDDIAVSMCPLTQATSQEICRVYNIPNQFHFCTGRAIPLAGKSQPMRQPDASFSMMKRAFRHCVVIEVQYTRTYKDTVNALRALLHFSDGVVRLGLSIKIQRPGKGNWKQSTEWKEDKNWHVWIQIFIT